MKSDATQSTAIDAFKVSMISETWIPDVNGVANTLRRLVDGLIKLGHEVELVRPRRFRNETPSLSTSYDELLVTGMPIPFYRDLHLGLPATALLMKRWSEDRPDVVHVATEGPLGYSAVVAASRLEIPVTSSFHTNFHTYSRHYRIGWFQSAIASYLKHIHNRTEITLVPTHQMVRDMHSTGYQRAALLSRGVDTQLFSPARRSNRLREQWGAGSDVLVVAHVGRLAPEKNLDLVIDAFEAIQKKRPDVRLLWVGDGPSRRSLETRYPEHIHAGMRSGVDLAAHYASADLFLFPSLTETFGNVVLEALASGLPVIAFDHAAAADVIRDDINGQRVRIDDATAFSHAAANLASDSAKLRRLGRNAPGSIASYRWDRIQEQFAGVLQTVITSYVRRRDRTDAVLMIPD